MDDSSVNFRGIMDPKGTSPEVISFLSQGVEKMFKDKKVAGKMKAGGSPLRVISRDKVMQMWQERQVYLEGLLKDLK